MRGRFALNELFSDAERIIDRDREAHTGARAAGGHDKRVDADELAFSIHERAAGIARIDSRIGLDHVGVDRARLRIGIGAVHRRDDAGRNGLFHAEGATSSHDPLAHLELGGVTDLDRLQGCAVDLDDSQVA